MVWIKLLGAFLTVGSGIMLSVTLNRRAARSLREAEAWALLIGQIKNEVECFSLPIREILAGVDRELLALCGYTGKAAPKSLSALVLSAAFTDAETGRIAERFASEFGRSYRDEQVGRCGYFFSLMEERKKKLASELPTKRKLNATLCLSGSLGALILFM